MPPVTRLCSRVAIASLFASLLLSPAELSAEEPAKKDADELTKKLVGTIWAREKFQATFIEFRKQGVLASLNKYKGDKEYRLNDSYIGRWKVTGESIAIEQASYLPNIKDPIRAKGVARFDKDKLVIKLTYDDGSVGEETYLIVK